MATLIDKVRQYMKKASPEAIGHRVADSASGISESARGFVHRVRAGMAERETELRETLNLRAWRASMGVSNRSDLSETQDHLLDGEDENVVMNPGGSPTGSPTPRREAAATFPKPIEVIEKHPTPVAPEKRGPQIPDLWTPAPHISL